MYVTESVLTQLRKRSIFVQKSLTIKHPPKSLRNRKLNQILEIFSTHDRANALTTRKKIDRKQTTTL